MQYTDSHEWIEVNEGIGTVGITQYAQNELGGIVFVELPAVGLQLDKGQGAVILESTKAAADIYSPVSGQVVEVNTKLLTSPELVNTSPEELGWLFKIKLLRSEEVKLLLSWTEYKKMIDS